jgi:AraC family transcriptional regulator
MHSSRGSGDRPQHRWHSHGALRHEANRLANDRPLGEADPFDIECLNAELRILDALAKLERHSPILKVIEALESRAASSLCDLAAIAGRHPVHLARIFKEKTGLTIGAYRRRLRLRDLCVDLKSDRAPLSELAARHGYSDQAHMTRELKAFTGTTPGAWRARLNPQHGAESAVAGRGS